MNVYVVKSGQFIDLVGWEWLNLRAFSDYDKAVNFSKTVEKQIMNFEMESVEIEELTLEA
jgi:hypothetical protein